MDLGGTRVQSLRGAGAVLPVWGAGYGPKALDLIGRAADGFILQLADPYLVEWTIKARARGGGGGRPGPGVDHDVRGRPGLRRR